MDITSLSGASITGTVEGELQPDQDTVGNLSRLSATYSAQPETLISFLPTLPTQFFTLSGTIDDVAEETTTPKNNLISHHCLPRSTTANDSLTN